MRRLALMIMVAAAGCSFETGGHVGDDDPVDASIGGDPDAAAVPDAGPECTTDEHCATPPNACKQPGSCDLEAGTCVFPDVDCSGEGDDCNLGVCEPATGACLKQAAFEGTACGAVTDCGVFAACEWEAGTCDESGTRSRDCTDFACAAGTCAGTLRVEQEACARDTDGVGCGATTCAGFGACHFAGTCLESGTKERDCNAYECGGGICNTLPFTDSDVCTRASRDGVSCALDSCGGFTECQYAPGNVCDEEGVRVRLCTPFRCTAEMCVDEPPYSDTAVCTRDTSAVVCDTVCTGSGEEVTCHPVICDGSSCPTG